MKRLLTLLIPIIMLTACGGTICIQCGEDGTLPRYMIKTDSSMYPESIVMIKGDSICAYYIIDHRHDDLGYNYYYISNDGLFHDISKEYISEYTATYLNCFASEYQKKNIPIPNDILEKIKEHPLSECTIYSMKEEYLDDWNLGKHKEIVTNDQIDVYFDIYNSGK